MSKSDGGKTAQKLHEMWEANVKLKAALIKYGYHTQECMRYQGANDDECDCGWNDLPESDA